MEHHPIKIISPPLWRAIQRKNFSRVESLADFLQLDSHLRSQILLHPEFPFQVPLRLAEKMAKGTLDDPLTRQFLPTLQEAEIHPQFVSDPVCDASFITEGKLLQKYRGRVLLICTGACAMHCRYCFRQNFAYERSLTHPSSAQRSSTHSSAFDRELKIIEQDNSVHEVILSGGDPLSLSDDALWQILGPLAKMPHIRRIRFHTRFPIGIPERIDEGFLDLIAHVPQQIYFVIHCNHPKELDSCIFDRLEALQRLRVIILNQAVLLKNVNDNADTQTQLAEELADRGILYYYLHQLDKVKGAAHFKSRRRRAGPCGRNHSPALRLCRSKIRARNFRRAEQDADHLKISCIKMQKGCRSLFFYTQFNLPFYPRPHLKKFLIQLCNKFRIFYFPAFYKGVF